MGGLFEVDVDCDRKVSAGFGPEAAAMVIEADTTAIGDQFKAVLATAMVGRIESAQTIVGKTLIEFLDIFSPVHRDRVEVDITFLEIKNLNDLLTGQFVDRIRRAGVGRRDGAGRLSGQRG
jgi:hypothetical protein